MMAAYEDKMLANRLGGGHKRTQGRRWARSIHTVCLAGLTAATDTTTPTQPDIVR